MSRRWWAGLLGAVVSVLAMAPGTASASSAPTPVWTQESPAASPIARYDASTAFDSGTGQFVLFGGINPTQGFQDDTWLWTGSTWSEQSPATSPSKRSQVSMAYDPATGQLVLFGGDASSGLLGDTWVWNGTTWAQQSPATSPPAREQASMAYDARTGQLVLFGGNGASGALADTWVWNGTTWAQQSPATSPPAREQASMAYDAGTGQLILFGGYTTQTTKPFGDTWDWTGSTWQQLSPVTSPSARYGAPMSFDPGTGQLTLAGGGATTIDDDTWTWNGSTWTNEAPSKSPPARAFSAMAYDPGTGQLVLFGGFSTTGSLADTWVWAPPTGLPVGWAQQSPATSPPEGVNYNDPSMAYDAGTGQLIYVGPSSSDVEQTWDWNGSTWTQLSPVTSPPPRADGAMAYDPGTGQFVLFGGDGGAGYLADTWVWNGSTWTGQSPSTSPPARSDASMAYDAATGQLILFGGENSSGQLGDTWAWSGSTWTQLSPAASPSARQGAALAYDPGTGQFVLFGGYHGGAVADTWTFNGSTWTELSPAASPAARFAASMDYDPGTGQLLLYGGSNGMPDSWTWNGSTWTQQSPTSAPSARSRAVMDFDASTGQLVLFSGSRDGSVLSDTWVWGSMIGAQTVMFSSSAPSSETIGGPSYMPAATASGASGNPVGFSVDGSTTNAACSISGGVVSFGHAGSCVIDAIQPGNDDYAAGEAQQTIMVSQLPQSIVFTSSAPTGATAEGASYQPAATGGGSGDPVSFSVDGSTTNSACSISGGVVSFLNGGSCVIDANQAGDGDYAAAAQVQQTIAVTAPTTTTSAPTTSAPTTTTSAPTTTTGATSTSPTPAPTTPTSTPTPTPTKTVKAVIDDQQIVLSTPVSSVCTASPVTVSLVSSLIKGSKARRATFVKAAFFLDRGVKHARRVKVHKKVRTVLTYTPNLTVHKASTTGRLNITKGVHMLKVVVFYRVRVTQGHHVKTVTVTKTITAKLHIC